jgi:protein-tyrosine phosphatase
LIDLHSHILPALDDGAPDLETSIAMARAAVEGGVTTMVATPHVNFDYPTESQDMARGVGELNVALARAQIPLAVLPGAEVAVTKIDSLDPNELARLGLGGGRTLLLECPYTTSVPFFEQQIGLLQRDRYRVLLAHPERSPLFRDDVDRLRRLVADGAMTVVNSGSIAGHLGEGSRKTALDLIAQGLVHAVASDSHDVRHRPPGLRAAFEAGDAELPGLALQIDWYVTDAPTAIISGRALPPRPAPPKRAKKRRFGLLTRG